MKITFYGTRGSIPVAGKHVARYGGNTTCLHIESAFIPDESWLIVDAGTGIVPLGSSASASGIRAIAVLFTHYHHDHTQGFLLCPLTFNRETKIHCYGPVEDGNGPLEVIKSIMNPPYFPMPFSEAPSQISGSGILSPSSMAIVIHPKGGFRTITTDELDHIEMNNPSQILMRQELCELQGCIVVRMQRTNHPQKTISYRFEEKPTGKVMVFLTDHENIDGTPQRLRRHLADADLLVMDSQYSRETYDQGTVGFGHGTPDYCIRVAHEVGARKVGLTHHDLFSSDETVDHILQTACRIAREVNFKGEVFACADYLSLEV